MRDFFKQGLDENVIHLVNITETTIENNKLLNLG